jgi:hypothetical protein
MRRVGVLAIAACAALAIGASLGSASASASPGYFAESFPAHITGEQQLGTTSIVIHESSYYCYGLGLNFTADEAPPIRTITPDMEGESCTGALKRPATLDPNGCTFQLTPTGKVEGGEWTGELSVGPAGCGAMNLEYLWNGNECTASISPQSVSGVTYTNFGAGSSKGVEVDPGSFGLAYEQVEQPGGCGSETGTATFTSRWSLTADVAGEPSPLQVADHAWDPIYLDESGFNALAYPVSIHGTQDPKNRFTLTVGGGSTTCSGVTFAGPALSEPSTSVYEFPEFTECITQLGFNFKSTIVNHGCFLVLHSGGGVDVACITGATSIELSIPAAGCVRKIFEQSGLTGVSFEGSGNITANLELGGISSTLVSGPPVLCGESESAGTFTGGSILEGWY